MTEAMNKTVINGTPRQNSIKMIDKLLAIGISERLPSANKMPKGSEATMAVVATTNVIRRPPQSLVSTLINPESKPVTTINAAMNISAHPAVPDIATISLKIFGSSPLFPRRLIVKSNRPSNVETPTTVVEKPLPPPLNITVANIG